jgi:hypothetical protein
MVAELISWSLLPLGRSELADHPTAVLGGKGSVRFDVDTVLLVVVVAFQKLSSLLCREAARQYKTI